MDQGLAPSVYTLSSVVKWLGPNGLPLARGLDHVRFTDFLGCQVLTTCQTIPLPIVVFKQGSWPMPSGWTGHSSLSAWLLWAQFSASLAQCSCTWLQGYAKMLHHASASAWVRSCRRPCSRRTCKILQLRSRGKTVFLLFQACITCKAYDRGARFYLKTHKVTRHFHSPTTVYVDWRVGGIVSG